VPTSASNPTAGENTTNTTGAVGDPAEPTVAETNFPDTTVPKGEEQDSTTEGIAGAAGEVWATYTGQQPSERGLTVRDLKELGDSEATEAVWWNAANRFQVNITEFHPMVVKYIEFQDGNFQVDRF